MFGWLPTVIFKAANLNLTFDDSQVKTGDAYINGSFDGVYGLLQKNKSDFSAVPLSLEALRGDFECPVKVITFDAETQHRVISSPSYNRTKIIFDIEDSISNIKTDVFVLLIFLFFFTRIVISGLRKLDSDGAMSMIMKEFTVKRYPKFLSWRAFRSVLQQGMDLRFPLASQSVIFCTFGIAASTLITLYHNHMSADLVSYSKPHLLNSLLDVWNAGNSVKVSFTEASNIASSFQKSPNGSLQNKIYQRSLNQWKGAAENFHLMPSSVLLRGSDLVTKEKVALLTQTAPIGILLGLECKDVFDSHPSPLKYSSIHVSKNVILTENFVFVTSLFIIPELEKRLLKYNRLASESGLIEMNLRRGPEFAVENIPLGRQPSMSCLHTKAWEVNLSFGAKR